MFGRFSGSPGDMSRPVARAGDHDITEQQFRSRVLRWRDTLSAISAAGVALYEPDGAEFAAILLGSWYAGKTVYLPGDIQPDTCAALAALDVVFAGAFPDNGAVDGTSTGTVTGSVSGTPAAYNGAEDLGPLDPTTANLVIFTSGSTGAPQAVHKQLAQLLTEVRSLELLFGATLGDCDIVATVSHQHIYGLLFKVLWPLVSHRTFVAESVVYPEQLIALLANGRPTAVVSGPAHLKRLPATLDWPSVRDNIVAVFASGGPLPADAVTATEARLGTTPVEVYGSSETGGIAWRCRTGGADCAWTPLPGVEVRSVDDCLAVRSPHLASADWFVMADYASFDDDGHFLLHGRADRLVKIEGKRVSLEGMERALLNTGLLADVRVVQLESTRDELGAVAVPNARGWESIIENGVKALRTQLDAVLTQSVERLAHPRRWRWLDALPVNADGKTSRLMLQQMFASAALLAPAAHALEISANRVVLVLYVSPHLAVFDGHFRGIPVLAGVAQLDWAVLLARRWFGLTAAFERMEAVKFLRVYQPGPLLTMELQWDVARRLLSFRTYSGETAHASGRLFFAA